MTAIILAAGTNEGWPYPKQLHRVNGETLLERQVKQLRSAEHLFMLTHYREVVHPLASSVRPARRRWKCETLLSSSPLWIGKTIVVHGDVYFTDAAMNMLLECSGKPVTLFWNNGKEGTEAYALVFDESQYPAMRKIVERLIEHCEKCNSPPHDGGFMQLWRFMAENDVPHSVIPITDETRDYDRYEP